MYRSASNNDDIIFCKLKHVIFEFTFKQNF
jgi:hypothetical protein